MIDGGMVVLSPEEVTASGDGWKHGDAVTRGSVVSGDRWRHGVAVTSGSVLCCSCTYVFT